jgi:hypothetical protein
LKRRVLTFEGSGKQAGCSSFSADATDFQYAADAAAADSQLPCTLPWVAPEDNNRALAALTALSL